MSKGNSSRKKTKVNLWQVNRQSWGSALGSVLALCLVIALVVTLFDLSGLHEQKDAGSAAAALRFSEVQTDNALTLPDKDGNAPDWIEIENTGSEPVSLKGISILIDSKVNKMFTFPAMRLGAGEFLLVYADEILSAADGNLHADFRLPASGGSQLYLFDTANTLLDSVELPEMEQDESYCRTGDGWAVTFNPTPGSRNDDYDVAPEAGITLIAGAVEISEVMSSNNAYLPDENGEFHDYIELHNISGAPLSLAGYWLSDDAAKLRKWALPAVTLPADGYLTLHCSGYDRKTNPAFLHTDFKLSSEGEHVYLTNAENETVSAVTLPALLCGQAWSLVGGKWTADFAPTPGAENSFAAASAADAGKHNSSVGVFISEAMAAPEDVQFDWIELYNASPAAVDISGCGLSDDLSQPRKWQFPAGTVIAPGQYLVVALTGEAEVKTGGRLSAPFALAAEGGYTLSFSSAGGQVLDTLYMPQQMTGISYGCVIGSGSGYLSAATPETANNVQLYVGMADRPQYSVPGGLYTTGDSFSVSLSAAPGARIYYTLDCTNPTEASTLYTGAPINVSGTTILRTRVYMDGCLPSIMDTQSYLFDVANAADVAFVVSLVSDPDGLFGYENGILVKGPNAWEDFPYGAYGQGANFWMDWARESHVELFKADGTTAVSQECDIKVHGRNSRGYVLKPMKVLARAAYGDPDFSYPIFSDREYDSYTSFILRFTGQDHQYVFMRDPLLTSQAKGSGLIYQEFELGILYLNGEYHAAVYLREHISTDYICRVHGWEGQEDIIDLVKGNDEAMQGSDATYAELLKWLQTNDNTTQAAYDKIDSLVDIDNFIEYIATMCVINPYDTVNVKRYRNPQADGKWRWILYDVDRGLRDDLDTFELLSKGTNATLFKAFMRHPELRERFLARLNEILATTYSSQALYDAAVAQYELLQPVLPDYLEVVDMTKKKYDALFGYFLRIIKNRPKQVLVHCQDYLQLTDDQMYSYFPDALKAISEFDVDV